jgi:hypothetical protein
MATTTPITPMIASVDMGMFDSAAARTMLSPDQDVVDTLLDD